MCACDHPQPCIRISQKNAIERGAIVDASVEGKCAGDGNDKVCIVVRIDTELDSLGSGRRGVQGVVGVVGGGTNDNGRGRERGAPCASYCIWLFV